MKALGNLVFVVAICALASCSQTSSTGSGDVTSSSSELQLASGIVTEVNRYRESKGLSQLRTHRGLARLAKKHSDYMMQKANGASDPGGLISHDGYEGRYDFAALGYGIGSIGENVIASFKLGQGSDLAPKIVRGWTSSSAHLDNIVEDWALTGVGVSFDGEGRAFVTQLYGSAPSLVNSVGGPSRTF